MREGRERKRGQNGRKENWKGRERKGNRMREREEK